MAGTYNFLNNSDGNAACDQGSTFQRRFTITDSLSVPINLTGYVARMQVRKNFSATATYIDATIANGQITITGASGIIDISVPDTVTDLIPAGKYRYDLEIESGAGVVTRLLNGTFQVTAQVTK